MSGGRPRTAIGTYGEIYVMRRGGRCVAETRYRDIDGRLRKVTASAKTASAATGRLKQRIADRPGHTVGKALQPGSPFAALADLWLADLERRDLADGTKDRYRDQLRLHVLPAFEHFTLGEITTGRVEWFLKGQAAVSDAQARQSRTMLNLLFGFALRHDALARNPVSGTSPLRARKDAPQALTWNRSRPSGPLPRTGERSPAGRARSLTVRCATSSRSSSAPRCDPARSSAFGSAMFWTVQKGCSSVSTARSSITRAPAPRDSAGRRPIRRSGASRRPSSSAAVLRDVSTRWVASNASERSLRPGRAAPSVRTTCAGPSASSSRTPASGTAESACAGTAELPRQSSHEASAPEPPPRTWATHRPRSPKGTTSSPIKESTGRPPTNSSSHCDRIGRLARCSRPPGP